MYLKSPTKKKPDDYLTDLENAQHQIEDLWDCVKAMHYKLMADPDYCPFEFGVRPKQLVESDKTKLIPLSAFKNSKVSKTNEFDRIRNKNNFLGVPPKPGPGLAWRARKGWPGP